MERCNATLRFFGPTLDHRASVIFVTSIRFRKRQRFFLVRNRFLVWFDKGVSYDPISSRAPAGVWPAAKRW